MRFPGLGSFLAGQICADVKFLEPLRSAPDFATFACSGPGSRAGMNYLLGSQVHNQSFPEFAWRAAHRQLREIIQPDLEKLGLGALSASDTQNGECEFSKLRHYQLFGTGLRKYVPRANGGGRV
jgi:hypothetical protein